MTNLVLLETHNQITTLTLNRPERHNGLVPEFLREMLNAIDETSKRPELRVLVLQANGRSFSTGGDVQAFPGIVRPITSWAPEPSHYDT
jgi:2-(1,2-epoxy-1,2-dihydrophenyl)acetyl-CoA isomerase